MSLFESLKAIHVGCAFVSIAGFALRGYWMVKDSPLLQRRLVKVLPHIVDTVLLACAAGMLVLLGTSPLKLDWLTAKILALLAYIALGMVALRFGRGKGVRCTAFVLALACAGYIFTAAYTKSPAGPLLLLGVVPG